MSKMKFEIDEIGTKTKIHNMTIVEAGKMREFSTHEDMLYADFNFPAYNDDEMISWYKIKTEKGKVLIAITDLYDNIVGYMTLRKINNLFKTSEMGIIIDPGKINMGYGSDAISSLKKWYFEKLKFRKLFLTVAIYNERALAVYKKIGFLPKYFLYERFFNDEVDVFLDKNYEAVKKYFKKSFNKVYIKCIKMELSTKNCG